VDDPALMTLLAKRMGDGPYLAAIRARDDGLSSNFTVFDSNRPPAWRRNRNGPRQATVQSQYLYGSRVFKMKIATFNVNDVKKRLANLLGWLRRARPDVACLQELKATDSEFPSAAIKKAGYGAIWRGQKSWNGVAILGRDCEPVATRTRLPGDPEDTQSRYIEAAVNGVLIATVYAPNGNPQPGPKFKYKLTWMKRLLAHAAELYALDAPVVLAGDFNVVPTDTDIYPTKSYANNALVQPEPRALFRRILDQGWIDAIRTMHPDAPMYTFWDYKRNRWERDAGLRIDHLLLNPKAAKRLVDAGVDREVRGVEGASDHAPAWIVVRDAPAARWKPARHSEKRTRPVSKRSARHPAPLSSHPLLVIDGDSFAHRSYHALPKTILRRGRKPAGAIRYGCLEAALEAGRFPAMAERLRLFRSLATMNRKAPLPSLRSQKPT
jgi:exodeoxyribonuclease III